MYLQSTYTQTYYMHSNTHQPVNTQTKKQIQAHKHTNKFSINIHTNKFTQKTDKHMTHTQL